MTRGQVREMVRLGVGDHRPTRRRARSLYWCGTRNRRRQFVARGRHHVDRCPRGRPPFVRRGCSVLRPDRGRPPGHPCISSRRAACDHDGVAACSALRFPLPRVVGTSNVSNRTTENRSIVNSAISSLVSAIRLLSRLLDISPDVVATRTRSRGVTGTSPQHPGQH